MSNEINEAIDEAVSKITDSGRCIWCEVADGEQRDDIIIASSGYAYYPDNGVPRNFTADSFVAAALMKDGRVCLIDGGGDWELEERQNVGAQGLAALRDLLPEIPDEYEYQRDYLEDYISTARRLWLESVLDAAAEMDDEFSDAAEKARDDDEESILFLLDNIEDIASQTNL